MSSLRSLADEATTSAENTQTHGSSVKRKRSEKNCHQCHNNDKETVVGCTKCKKKYCIPCITKWYSTLGMADVVEACPVCRNICNCAACLKPKNLPIPDFKLGAAERMQHSNEIVKALLPFLKQFVAQENMEREEEARIQGLPITGLNLSKSNLRENDHMLCCYCKSSIMDVHRSCLNCLFKLCVTCCVEIRDGSSRANHRCPMAPSKESSRVATEWIVTDNGTIVCPPESLGGCGHQNLKLMSRYPTNWVSELLLKAEAVPNVGNVTDSLEAFGLACSGSSLGSDMDNATLLAYREDSNGNYLHCPTALVVKENDLKHFRRHIRRGEPVVVSDVLSGGTGLSWEPMVMWRACRKPRKLDHGHLIREFRVLNCSSWSGEMISIHQFFKGYVEGLFDAEGRHKTLKLEDWPPAESFQEELPRHFLEFVRCLPFILYTHPHTGHLNMSTRTPMISRKLDLGPKMSVCYGVGQELGSSSPTMIHYALSDMVNILTHTAAICPSPEQLSGVEKRSRKNKEEVKKNQRSQMDNENGGQKCLDPSISSSRVEGFKEPEGGAVWDIFRRQDVPKLEEYLRKHAGELKKHISLPQQLAHPLHDKAFYLTVEHQRKLKEEYCIEPWTFVQKLGDAVFVPAGCPHQIRHLKPCTSVALNFVAPESIGECIRLSAEYRSLPQNHKCKEDNLQVKQMTLHAVHQAVRYLGMVTPGTSTSQVNPADGGQTTELPLCDLVFIKQLMKENLSELEEKGHLVDRYTRAYLERSAKDFISRIDQEMQKIAIFHDNCQP